MTYLDDCDIIGLELSDLVVWAADEVKLRLAVWGVGTRDGK